MVCRIIAVSVLQRLGATAAVFYGLRLLFATREFKVNCRVKVIGVSFEEGDVISS